MVTFQPFPIAGESPYMPKLGVWAASVEAEVAATETVAAAALPSASFDTRLGTRVKVDNTVGRTVHVWDATNSRWQLVYGDTGQRELTLPPELSGATVTKISTNRSTHHVTFGFQNLVCAAGSVIATLPVGFRPASLRRYSISLATGGTASIAFDTSGTVTVAQALTSAAPGNFDTVWRTYQAWPTALPGTGSGTIPNA